MIFKLIKESLRETLTETSAVTAWFKDNFIFILGMLVMISTVFGWVTLLMILVQTYIGKTGFTFLLFLAISTVTVLPIISFFMKFMTKLENKYQRYLEDQREIFRRLSE